MSAPQRGWASRASRRQGNFSSCETQLNNSAFGDLKAKVAVPFGSATVFDLIRAERAFSNLENYPDAKL